MKTEKATTFIVQLVMVLCIFIVSGCHHERTSVARVSADEVRANLKYENIVFRDFNAVPEIISPQVTLVECSSAAIAHLKSKNVFKNVEMAGSQTFKEPTLFVDVTLTDLRIVSTATRIWTGVLSGRSHMKINVKLTDSSGLVVAEQELVGIPGAYGSAYSAGAADRELPYHMGILLGDFILANVSNK